jgi:hypothetical protein
MTSPVKTAEYKLRRKYWDGQRIHGVGEVLSFPVGKAPRTAELVAVETPTPPQLPKATK